MVRLTDDTNEAHPANLYPLVVMNAFDFGSSPCRQSIEYPLSVAHVSGTV